MGPSIKHTKSKAFKEAKKLLRSQGGTFRVSEAVKAGIHPRTFYAMRDQGGIERLGRGVYRLAGKSALGSPDLAIVAMKVPKGVVCLISALSFHEITTEIPHQVHLALPRGSEPPRLDYPPVRVYWFSGPAFEEGIEHHKIDNIPIKVYSLEKTIADCFKYRNKIGMDVVLEALKFYRQRKKFKTDVLLRYAKVCRVERVMQPYIEALL